MDYPFDYDFTGIKFCTIPKIVFTETKYRFVLVYFEDVGH
jgi:hypothetical protein